MDRKVPRDTRVQLRGQHTWKVPYPTWMPVAFYDAAQLDELAQRGESARLSEQAKIGRGWRRARTGQEVEVHLSAGHYD